MKMILLTGSTYHDLLFEPLKYFWIQKRKKEKAKLMPNKSLDEIMVHF